MDTAREIEALLFIKGDAISFKDIGRILDIPEAEAKKATQLLQEQLSDRGVQVTMTEQEAELRTAPEAHRVAEAIQHEELSDTLGKASMETLAIILYKGPVSRAQIEYIRGVSATAALRTLLMRDLIAREQHPTDTRSYVYVPTAALLGHLGISNSKELPSYDEFVKELTALEETFSEHEQ